MTRTDTTPIEESLRAMLAAEAERLQESDLRPLAPLPAPSRGGSGRTRTVGAVLAAAATTAGVLLGAHLIAEPTPGGPASPPVVTASTFRTPLSVTFSSRTITLTGPEATVVTPVPHVRAVDPQVAERVAQAVEQQLADVRNSFRSRITDPGVTASGLPGTPRQEIVATTVTWRQFLTVRLDDTETDTITADDGSPRALKEHTALIVDTTTGERVLPPDLFTDLDRASAVVRAALVADHADHVTADDLAPLSLRPSEAGTTTPLTCYPTAEGLHCAVDEGSRTIYAGPLESVIPWDALSPLLKPHLRG